MKAKRYFWEPKPDITAYELARLIPLRFRTAEKEFPEGIPPELARHLRDWDEPADKKEEHGRK